MLATIVVTLFLIVEIIRVVNVVIIGVAMSVPKQKAGDKKRKNSLQKDQDGRKRQVVVTVEKKTLGI
ncbi:hypothetical protein BSK59_13945 [Paenibacillus odorifer]|uniref:hypothetical protein n=1 Tax=Paenibacillus odorifer TaxID=189426 RepID=UPI00096E8AEF|nr:hypothetical protein [Paenibacillus odorifer]OME55572.1 hypothetical protein BSK59_13945 [Paenibacillus odorifer]